jgi:WD40 repeat protein
VLASTASPVRDLAVARVAGGGCVIASVQQDGEVRVRASTVDEDDAIAWRDVVRRNAGGRAQTLAMSTDGKWVVVGRADGHVVTLDAADGRVVQDLAAHREGVNVVRLTPDGRTLVTGGSDDVARLWHWRGDSGGGGWEAAAEMPCGGDVIGAAIRPDGGSVAMSARPWRLLFWELPSGRSLGKVDAPAMPWRLAYSPDGRRITAGSWERSVQIWEVSATTTPTAPARLGAMLRGHTQLVLNEAFDASGELLARVSQDGSLRVWDLAGLGEGDVGAAPQADRRRCLVSLEAGAGDSLAVGFLPPRPGAGLSVAVGYFDGTVRIWELGYFDRHLQGQVAYQRELRSGAAAWPARGPK